MPHPHANGTDGMNRQWGRTIAILLIVGASCFWGTAQASHIAAADLYYTWIGGLNYRITLVLYANCGAESISAFSGLQIAEPEICVFKGDTLIGKEKLYLQPPICGTEISPVICPGTTTQCVDLNSVRPGFKQFVYSANVTLTGTSRYWRFMYSGNNGNYTRAYTCPGYNGSGSPSRSGRPQSITNILNAGNTIMQLIDTLNNTGQPNSSPAFLQLPTDVFCMGAANCYNPRARDTMDATSGRPNGDSLRFLLVPCASGNPTTNCIPGGPVYYSTQAWTYPTPEPLSGAYPLEVDSAGNFSFDAATGQICFRSHKYQRSNAVFNVREFRNGQLVGTCQREMTFEIQDCEAGQPDGDFESATAGNLGDSSNLAICLDAGDFSMKMFPTDGHPEANITVTASGLPTGATFVVNNNNTPNPECTFAWSTTGKAPGTYEFTITFTDNHCPYPGLQVRQYAITVTAPLQLQPKTTNDTCLGSYGTAAVGVVGGKAPYTYRWSTDSAKAQMIGIPAGQYAVTVTDVSGCRAATEMAVQDDICPEIIVHDVLTPNGDGTNDSWVIEGIVHYPTSTVQVFNKWGNLVYDAYAYRNNWQGAGNTGQALPDGTYYYIVKLNTRNVAGGQNQFTGSLLLKR